MLFSPLRALVLAIVASSSFALGGCSSAATSAASAGGGFGATPGGAQDVGLFRAKIARGERPRASDLNVEGMLAEHDLPVLGDPCTQPLCLGAATAIAAGADDGATGAWVELGFSSSIDPATFYRPDLDLAVVVDRSGSMGGVKIAAARQALTKLVAQLGARDRLSIVIFDDQVDVLVAPTFLTTSAERQRVLGLVAGIEARGSTDIESGLAQGFRFAQADAGNKERSHRVMLFTDAQPNVGATDPASFEGMVSANAKGGIGFTAFGIGLDFGQELVHAISQARGGSYFFLGDETKLSTVFDKDFDLLVTPVAYGMKVAVGAQSSWTYSTAYGVPSTSVAGGALALDVPTVFLSRNKGAIVLRYAPKSTGLTAAELRAVAHLSVDYQTPEGANVHQDVDATYGGAAGIEPGSAWYSQSGVRKAVALTNWVLGAKGALARLESGDRSGALARLAEVRAAFAAHVDALNDDDLRRELVLLDELVRLI